MSALSVFVDWHTENGLKKVSHPTDETWLRERIAVLRDLSAPPLGRKLAAKALAESDGPSILWALHLEICREEPIPVANRAYVVAAVRMARRMINAAAGLASCSVSGGELLDDARDHAFSLRYLEGHQIDTIVDILSSVAESCGSAAYAGYPGREGSVRTEIGRIVREGFGLV